MKKGIVVLSLFDGMSCGRIAFDRAGIKVKKYYASEIDKYAITVAQSNYPNTIQLGSITEWKSWKIEKPNIIIGGSPCQGFSFAGKQLNFEDERSKLFFTFVDILKHYKPKYFLLENVRMKKEYQKVISDCLGVEPFEINSVLVSAQNRKRLYWTNIKGVTQPKDKDVLLKDIIINANTEKLKAYCIDANYAKGANEKQYSEKSRRQLVKNTRRFDEKSLSLTTNGNKTGSGVTVIPHVRQWRKLTPIECERLQTVPDNYTNHVSNSQRYKMLGNGWTVDVIAHIFRGLK